MNRISPVGEKCVNRQTNFKYWFLNAVFVVAAVLILSLTGSTANAQTPSPGNTISASNCTATSAPINVVESAIGPQAMGYFNYNLVGLRSPIYAVTNSINALLLEMTGGGNTAPTDLAVNEPDQQTQTTTQAGPCVAQMPATKPKQ